MHPNAQLIQTFYSCFQNLDAMGMKNCYHPEARFSDPAFPNLTGKKVSAMWAMLTDNLKKGNHPWRLEFGNITASDVEGACHWEAYYTLSATGRKVHNIIEAKFKFNNGLVIEHTDRFDFYRWARMGFGWPGMVMGWTPFFQKKVQVRVNGLLEKYMATHPE